jgi:hypothetical protein
VALRASKSRTQDLSLALISSQIIFSKRLSSSASRNLPRTNGPAMRCKSRGHCRHRGESNSAQRAAHGHSQMLCVSVLSAHECLLCQLKRCIWVQPRLHHLVMAEWQCRSCAQALCAYHMAQVAHLDAR